MDQFNIDDYKSTQPSVEESRYAKRLRLLEDEGKSTSSIEKTVEQAIDNLDYGVDSFVIFGEPQSGKTEMMIALTARLFDTGRRVVVVLMNDSVQLLEQNLDRFLRSGIDPAPKPFNDILDPAIDVKKGNWLVFCKKNSADLTKLLTKIEGLKEKVIIDDEADYATPNAKVNKDEQTRINKLVGKLLKNDGVYIGVTATPARLDLNNTFSNDNSSWVKFEPHAAYTGPQTFFPTKYEKADNPGFRLNLMNDTGDDPKHLRSALLSFMVNVAHLNCSVNAHPKNYSMLVHTSGKKVDHEVDYQNVNKVLGTLGDTSSSAFERYVEEVWKIASARFPDQANSLTRYVVQNVKKSNVIVMNSNSKRNVTKYKQATSPASLFTIAIGGNIVSRGVTFEDLLSMFFTRDVKHKIQQDTYIQRARMFGSRASYAEHFELFIPRKLYGDWQRCFVFHHLALSSIEADKGSPVWLEDKRISAVASSSIDKAAVALSSGEMSWDIFDWDIKLNNLADDKRLSSLQKIEELRAQVGEEALPEHVVSFITDFNFGDASIAVHKAGLVGAKYDEAIQKNIRRSKGLMASNTLERERFPNAVHHVKIFRNPHGQARVFYKYTPEAGTIRFLENKSSGK